MGIRRPRNGDAEGIIQCLTHGGNFKRMDIEQNLKFLHDQLKSDALVIDNHIHRIDLSHAFVSIENSIIVGFVSYRDNVITMLEVLPEHKEKRSLLIAEVVDYVKGEIVIPERDISRLCYIVGPRNHIIWGFQYVF